MRKFVLFLIIVAFALTSCNNKNTHSPEITISKVLVNGEPMVGDSIVVGDSLQFYLVLNPFSNDRLISFQCKFEHSYLKDSLFSAEAFEKFCDETKSDRDKSLYYFKNLNNGEVLLLGKAALIAKQSPNTASNKVTIEFALTSSSDVPADYNPSRVSTSVRIFEPKDD